MTSENTQTQSMSKVLSVGIIGIALVLVIAAVCIFPFEHHTFVDWVATAFMAATPTQIILGLLWHNSKPDFVNSLSQPAKGLMLTAITVLMGALVFGLILLLVSGGHGITPMLIQFTIMTVVVVLWMVPIWQCWPLTLISKDPFVFGILTLVFSYLLAYLLWLVFFDYSILSEIGHPHYYPDLDPGGLFDMWTALTFAVTSVSVIIVHILFEFWPIDKLSLGKGQPTRGLIAALYVFALAWLIRSAFVTGLGMDQVEYLVRVPVSLIFGTFLVNNMMQQALLRHLAQPLRGFVLTVIAAFAAVIMYQLYGLASAWHTGQELGMGPQNGFAKELWIASAMLGVTFPIIFLVSGFFGFWPIKRTAKE